VTDVVSEVRSADGSTIGWATIGNGPPIVLVHGTAVDRRSWNGVRRRLADGFTVHTMDRRGRGLSIAEHAPYDIAREAEDVAAVVEAVGRDVYVVGHSYGARCALEAALITDAIGRMFLYEPPMPTSEHRVARAGILARLRDLAATGADDALLSTFLIEAVQLAPDAVEAMHRTKAWSALLANARLIPRELDCVQRTDVLDRLGQLARPVRLLVGTASADYMRPAAEAIVDALPDADLVELPGQGHTANDTAPDQLAAAIGDFAS
jgi:pimeloyl-ACP methyl ester carboxylesterase